MVNLLLNPEFEEGTIGNPSYWTKLYTTPAEPEFMYPEQGKSVGDISVGIRFESGMLVQSVTIDPTKKYILSGYIKTLGIEDIRVGNILPSAGIIGIIWKSTSGYSINKVDMCSVSGSTFWAQCQRILIPDPGTVTGMVFLALRTSGAGTVWFDSISLEETACDTIVDCTFIVT